MCDDNFIVVAGSEDILFYVPALFYTNKMDGLQTRISDVIRQYTDTTAGTNELTGFEDFILNDDIICVIQGRKWEKVRYLWSDFRGILDLSVPEIKFTFDPIAPRSANDTLIYLILMRKTESGEYSGYLLKQMLEDGNCVFDVLTGNCRFSDCDHSEDTDSEDSDSDWDSDSDSDSDWDSGLFIEYSCGWGVDLDCLLPPAA